MGNTQSNAAEQPEPNSESIERYYAALRDDYQGRTGAPSSQCADSDVRQPRLSTYGNQVDAPNTESSATNNGHTDSMDSMINISRLHSLRDAPYRAGSMGDFDRATVYLAQAVTFTSAARDHSIQMLKKIDLKIVAKAILEWIKAHLYETAAIVVPLLLLACTPGLLGLLGFGTTGIAAGTSPSKLGSTKKLTRSRKHCSRHPCWTR